MKAKTIRVPWQVHKTDVVRPSERRDKVRRQPAVCTFCGKDIKGTPKKLAGLKGVMWYEEWINHLIAHVFDVENGVPTKEGVRQALWAAMSVKDEYDRNK